MNFENLVKVDEEIYNLVGKELEREQEGIELIASENFASKAVMEAMGSYLTNKYAEGYPAKRYYGGCQVVDEVEELARERAKKLFWSRTCQCTTTFRITSKYGSVLYNTSTR